MKDLALFFLLVKVLPTFFRTLRGQKPTKVEMVKLAEKIRDGMK